jgi:hypothetical protein
MLRYKLYMFKLFQFSVKLTVTTSVSSQPGRDIPTNNSTWHCNYEVWDSARYQSGFYNQHVLFFLHFTEPFTAVRQ